MRVVHVSVAVALPLPYAHVSLLDRLLMAVAQDGDNKTIPIAFALVEGETKEGWGFFYEESENACHTRKDCMCDL